VVVFDTSGPEGKVFANKSRAARRAREALFRRLSLDAIAVRTDRPYLPALTSFFEARARRCGIDRVGSGRLLTAAPTDAGGTPTRSRARWRLPHAPDAPTVTARWTRQKPAWAMPCTCPSRRSVPSPRRSSCPRTSICRLFPNWSDAWKKRTWRRKDAPRVCANRGSLSAGRAGDPCRGGDLLRHRRRSAEARTPPIPVTITSLTANEPEPKLKENAGPCR